LPRNESGHIQASIRFDKSKEIWREIQGAFTQSGDAPTVEAVASDGARIFTLVRGGKLVSWCDARGLDQLYLSPNTQTTGDLPVRGGVPVIIPQFGAMGTFPRHGLARLIGWGALENRLALEWSHSASSEAV
jgi:D-hexose-6-phosphate mutarotase